MVKMNFNLQGLNKTSNHLDELKNIIDMKDSKHVILSTAFLNQKGVSLIEDSIRKSSKNFTFFIGVRNGVTTSQGISKLLDLGVEIYIVDTGLNHRILHHKLFIAYNKYEYRINIGSANLTRGGLLNNIEASVTLEGSFPDKNITDIITTFKNLSPNYPENVFKISNYEDIDTALRNGQLENENIKKERIKGSSSIIKNENLTPPMNLPKFQTNEINTEKIKLSKILKCKLNN